MPDTFALHLLHTNDIHSQFANMPRIATCLKLLRKRFEQSGEHVITVDLGDHADRSNIMTEATWGHANVAVLNASGYQYVTIGNNEGLTFPKAELEKLYESASFQVVLGNVKDEAGEQPRWAVSSVIHQWEGGTVALLGVTKSFPHFYGMLGWKAEEPFAFLQAQVQQLRPRVDVLVLLSHLGYKHDCQIAEAIEGIDVILGGHTHHLLPKGERVGNTLIAQAGRFGEYVGHVRLEVDRTQRAVREACAELVSVSAYEEDSDINALIERERLEAVRILGQPVTTLSFDLEPAIDRETAFGNFLAASLRMWTEAEAGMAIGGLLLTRLAEGLVTRKDLLECLPHPIKPWSVSLTGTQILRILERFAKPDTYLSELQGFGFRGSRVGWLHLDGIRVEYTPGADPAICLVEINGERLQPERSYRVGAMDLFLFHPFFSEFQTGADHQFFLPEVLREVVAETIQNTHLLKESCLPRWIPVK